MRRGDGIELFIFYILHAAERIGERAVFQIVIHGVAFKIPPQSVGYDVVGKKRARGRMRPARFVFLAAERGVFVVPPLGVFEHDCTRARIDGGDGKFLSERAGEFFRRVCGSQIKISRKFSVDQKVPDDAADEI